jgi:hypothetical protein
MFILRSRQAPARAFLLDPAHPMAEQQKVSIVILGGGFGGVVTAKEVVHLVNDENYFVFQPLLAEVVSCGIEPVHILNPIRRLCPRVQFHCGIVAHLILHRDAGIILVFGIGSIVGMMLLLGILIRLPLVLSASLGRRSQLAVQGLASLGSVGIGFVMIFRSALGEGTL